MDGKQIVSTDVYKKCIIFYDRVYISNLIHFPYINISQILFVFVVYLYLILFYKFYIHY